MVRNIAGHYSAKMCTKKVMKFTVKYEDHTVGLLTIRNRERRSDSTTGLVPK